MMKGLAERTAWVDVTSLYINTSLTGSPAKTLLCLFIKHHPQRQWQHDYGDLFQQLSTSLPPNCGDKDFGRINISRIGSSVRFVTGTHHAVKH